MNLLSDNDFRHLETARLRGERITLERSFRGAYTIYASTIPATHAWHPVTMLIQIREEYGNIIAIQNFRNIEELKRALT